MASTRPTDAVDIDSASLPRPPGPPGHWFSGNLGEFRRDMLAFFTRCAREYGDIVSMRLGPRRVHLASHPDFIEQVLVADNRKFGKSYVFQLLRTVLGNGLVTSEGDFWLRQRRLMQPAFNRASVNSYAGPIVSSTEELMRQWHDGDQVDLHREMSRLALAIVGRALMDIDLAAVTAEVAEPLEEAMRDFSRRFESPWHFPNWIPTPMNRRAKRNTRKLDAVVNRIIRQRRQSGGDHGDLLSKLIHARDEVDQTGMTDQQLRDEVMTLFLAGHETTATALAWTWLLLDQNPEVADKLLAELNSVLAGRMPEVHDVPNLVYTEAVIKESMRLYPPVFAFSRRVLSDVAIGGYRIPAGTAVIMSQWVVHRDPRWFDAPEVFRPERWLAAPAEPCGGSCPQPLEPPKDAAAGDSRNSIKKRPDYAYFPFGGGPRVCIGNTFAMLEAILAIAAIAPRFQFVLTDSKQVRPWPSVTLRPAGGIPATIHARTPK